MITNETQQEKQNQEATSGKKVTSENLRFFEIFGNSPLCCLDEQNKQETNKYFVVISSFLVDAEAFSNTTGFFVWGFCVFFCWKSSFCQSVVLLGKKEIKKIMRVFASETVLRRENKKREKKTENEWSSRKPKQ